MKALLWKDYRLQRLVLIFGVLALAAPYVICLAYDAYAHWHGRELLRYREFWLYVNVMSLSLSMVTCALLGGNAFAGERTDRSAEFLAYLPPSRAAIVRSKATVALLAVALIWGISLVIRQWIAIALPPAPRDFTYAEDDQVAAIAVILATSPLMFGAGWLVSTFLSSAGLAGGAGIVAPIFLAGTLQTVQWWLAPAEFNFAQWYCTLALVLGILAFVAGSVYYLRRVEP